LGLLNEGQKAVCQDFRHVARVAENIGYGCAKSGFQRAANGLLAGQGCMSLICRASKF
jgi:hypothetical protein